MAKSKVHQKTRAPKGRAEQPVTEGIHRAAERIGVTPIASADLSPESVAAWKAKRQAVATLPLTITLAEACDLVGRDLEPTRFQEQVFDVIARELDVLSDLGENDNAGFDGWCAFQCLIARIQLAGKIAAVIGGAS